MSLASFIRAMPKAELHVHLEGSTRPATLLELARRSGVALPATTLDELRAYYRFTDFRHFIDIYKTIVDCLRTPDDFALIAEEFGHTMSEQNIRYAELTWSPISHVDRTGFSFEQLLDGVNRGRERARQLYGVQMRWITDIVRNVHGRIEDGSRTAEMAVWGRDHGVVALGLGGFEPGYPPELFVAPFEYAIANGLHSAPHAGEAAGPESVWGALRALRAERIGHGIAAAEDPDLVVYLAERRVPLEVCPTSNLCTGVVKSAAEHPIRRLWDAGVYVTVNSDDPPMFGTTLTDELLLLAREWAFDAGEIEQLALNALRAAFLPADERERMEREWTAELARLRREHGVV